MTRYGPKPDVRRRSNLTGRMQPRPSCQVRRSEASCSRSRAQYFHASWPAAQAPRLWAIRYARRSLGATPVRSSSTNVSTTEVISNESDRQSSAQELNFQGSYQMNLSIEPLSTQHFEGLRLALDTVAREKRFLSFTEAPPEEDSWALCSSIVANRWRQMIAALEGVVAGWCDVLPTHGQARSHVGTHGIGLMPSTRHRAWG